MFRYFNATICSAMRPLLLAVVLIRATKVQEEECEGDERALTAAVMTEREPLAMTRLLEHRLCREPMNGGVRSALGQALEVVGESDRARDELKRAAELDSQWSTNYARWLMHHGHYTDALAAVSSKEELAPEPAFLRSLTKIDLLACCFPEEEDGLIDELQSALLTFEETLTSLSDAGSKGVVRSQFLFGKLYERAGDYATALSHFQKANDLQAARNLPMKDLYGPQTKNALCARDKLRERRIGISRETRTPIFIVGAPRSGTTLLEGLLTTHPAIVGLGETTAFPDAIRPFLNNSCDHDWTGDITGVASSYFDAVDKRLKTNEKFIVDKQLFNFLTVGFMEEVLGPSKVILVTRNRLDNAASLYFTMLDDLPFASSLDTIRQFFQIFDDTITKWRRLEVPMYELRYEDLVKDPVDELTAIFRWLDLDLAPAVERQVREGDDRDSAAVTDVRKPVYKKRINFSQPYLATPEGHRLFGPFTR